MQQLNSYEWNTLSRLSGDDKNSSKIPKNSCAHFLVFTPMLQLTGFSLPTPGATQTAINEKVSVEQLCDVIVWAVATNLSG